MQKSNYFAIKQISIKTINKDLKLAKQVIDEIEVMRELSGRKLGYDVKDSSNIVKLH